MHSHPSRATVPQSYFSIDAEQTAVNTEQCCKDKHPYFASCKKQWNQMWRKETLRQYWIQQRKRRQRAKWRDTAFSAVLALRTSLIVHKHYIFIISVKWKNSSPSSRIVQRQSEIKIWRVSTYQKCNSCEYCALHTLWVLKKCSFQQPLVQMHV